MTGAATAPARTIMYLCYGSPAIYDQTFYSLFSLLRVLGTARERVRIVVYGDQPRAFAALPVETVLTDAAQLDAWLGESDYIHRRKTCAILDVLDRFGGSVVFVDSDTYWTRSPAQLFDRIEPGAAVFHLAEGALLKTGTPFDDALARQLGSGGYTIGGVPVVVDARTVMWNTGVVGVAAADRRRVRDALDLSDAIWAGADPAGAYGKKIHHAEQFAMGYAFRDCRLREARDWVYHYWPAGAKAAFAPRLRELVAQGLADPSAATFERLYAARYREQGVAALIERAKMAVRATALAAGRPLRGVRRSV